MNRRFKQVAKGFVGKMVPSKKTSQERSQERLFQGSMLQGARREALLRCVDPNLEGVPIALQRTEVRMCIEFNMYNFHICSITYLMFTFAG